MKKLFFLVLFSIVVTAVSHAQKWQVEKYVSEIESRVNTINEKASNQNITGALNELGQLNESLRRASYDFSDWYQKAREDDPGYTFHLNVKLAPQLDAAYWRKMLQRIDKNKKLLNEALAGIPYDNSLDNQDEAWAYLTTIYNMGKSLIDIGEKGFGSEKSYFSVFFTAKEGIDQFIDDYKKIEEAGIQKLETQAKAQQISMLISRARKMGRNYETFEQKMNRGKTQVDDFNNQIKWLNQEANNINAQPLHKIDWSAPRYKFVGTPFLERIKTEENRLKDGYITWGDFKNSYLSISQKALNEKKRALAEINQSDDEAAKGLSIDNVNDAYDTFSKESHAIFHSMQTEYDNENTTGESNLNYQIKNYAPIHYPGTRNLDPGSAGDQMQLSANKAEASVQSFVNYIYAQVKLVNKLANEKNMKEAVNELGKLNSRIDWELDDFTKNYRMAREENPDFTIRVDAHLSGRFQAAYWVKSLNETTRRLNELTNLYYATPKSNARKYWEFTYAICKSIYDIVQLPQDVHEELKKKGNQEGWDKAKEGISGLKDDYVKLEAAYNTPDNYQMPKAKIEDLMKKAKQTANSLEALADYMKINQGEAVVFNKNIDQLNKLKKEVESGPRKAISLDDNRYNFNESDFYKRLNKLVDSFKSGEIDWNTFDLQWKQLNAEAESQKQQVISNIKASDDLESKKQFSINIETNDWEVYHTDAIEVHDSCFALRKQNKEAGSGAYSQLFAGSSATTSVKHEKSPTPRQANSSQRTTLSGHRIKNIFFNGSWADLGGTKQAFKQNGDLVEIVGVGTGEITNGILVYSFKDRDGKSRRYEYRLVGDGFTMQVKKERTRRNIYDKLYLANGMHRPPTKAEIENDRKKNGDFLIFKRTYAASNAVFGKDTDGDQVADEFDHCPNTQKGLTVNNGGVNIMGCQVGQNTDLQTKTSPENNNKTTTNTSASHAFSYSPQQQPIKTNRPTASSTTEQNKPKPAANRLNTIGTIHTDGKGKGNYLSLKIENINKTDIIEFYLISGKMRVIQVIWRYNYGGWSTKYQGTKTRFVASELLDGITKNVTHLNFVVNSYHNFYGKPACKMGITHLTKDGGIPTYRQKTNKKASVNKELPKGSSEFELLLAKATTAFNKPYWKDNNARKTSINATNPKQESFNYLKKAATQLNQESNLSKKYNMVYRFIHVASGFAKRVYSNKAKMEFIQLAGNTLSIYSNNISSLSKNINGMSAPKARAMAYKKVAEAWRELTSAGLWGNSQYNKKYCDKQSKKYYTLALNEDRKDVELQRTVEKINAPKKPVPQAVKQFKEIEPEVWNKAQDIMVHLDEDEPVIKEPEKNFMEVGKLTTLEHSSGTVSVLPSGADEWKEITDNEYVIFPGDKIKTSADAKDVSVTYSSDHTFLAIKPNSIVEFDEERLFIIHVDTHLNVVKSGSKFLVITPTAVLGVRGTQFEVDVKADKTTETYLYKGVVEVRNKDDIGYLVPGEKIISRKNETKLKQETFNRQYRLQTHWKDIEALQIRHNHILATVPASNRYHSKSNNNASARTSSGTYHKTTRKSPPPAYRPAKVYISTSPDNQYRPALALKESPYGSLNLVGHCPIHITQNTPITVKWYINNQPKAISTGKYVAEPKVPYFNGVLSASQAPLLPGLYRVEFFMNNRIIGKGSIRIRAPQKISGEDAQQVYLNALQKMQAGMECFFQGNVPDMKQQVRAAMPGLRKALYSAPNLPDVYAVYETANALLALEKVDQAIRNSQKRKAKTWLDISSVYTKSALINCHDQGFKISIQKIQMVNSKLVNQIQ